MSDDAADRSITVLDPVGRAWDRMVELFFRPFRAGTWIAVAFATWVAALGEGGGGTLDVVSNLPTTPNQLARQYLGWLQADAMLTVLATAVTIFVVVGIFAFVTWIRSRFDLIQVDMLARRRGAIAEPWRLHRDAANRLFRVSFALAAATILLLGLLASLFLILILPEIESGAATTAHWVGVGVIAFAMLVVSLAAKILGVALGVFAVPWLWRHEGARPLDVLRRLPETLRGRWLSVVGFVVMRIGIGMLIGAAGFVLMLLTCCVSLLPFVTTLLLAPLLVFDRWYALAFVEQLGPDWQVHGVAAEVPRCAKCGFDLRATESDRCPECGHEIGAVPHRCHNCRCDLADELGERCPECGEPIRPPADPVAAEAFAARRAKAMPPPPPAPPASPPGSRPPIPIPDEGDPDGDADGPGEEASGATTDARSDPPGWSWPDERADAPADPPTGPAADDDGPPTAPALPSRDAAGDDGRPPASDAAPDAMSEQDASADDGDAADDRDDDQDPRPR